MERQIIRIDEDKCDGCGLCATGCPEGALQMIDGKARLVSELTCDGLGACLGECPRGAIQVETREAAPYDERRTLDQILPKGGATLTAHLEHLHAHAQTAHLATALAYLAELGVRPDARALPGHQVGEHEGGRRGSAATARSPLVQVKPPPFRPHHPQACPGSAPRILAPAPAARRGEGLSSQLSQWPVQLHLISPGNPVFQGADLLLAADCTAFALPDFNQKYLPGKKLAIACPKLDGNQEVYLAKLTALIDEAGLKSITVMIMEVPCCGGLLRIAQMAAQQASRKLPVQVLVVGIGGEVRGPRA